MRHLLHSLTFRTVVRVSPVMPQNKNPGARLGFAEEQVVRKRPKVGTPQHSGNEVKAPRIPFNGCDQLFEFLVKTPREFRPNRLFVIGQNAPEVFPNQAMESQAHRRGG
jgi:hypothetical protein